MKVKKTSPSSGMQYLDCSFSLQLRPWIILITCLFASSIGTLHCKSATPTDPVAAAEVRRLLQDADSDDR